MIDDFRLYYPAKPFRLTQGWGIYNPAYQQFGFTRHNGVDFSLGADSKLYAPAPGTIVRLGNYPSGAGIFFSLITDEYRFPDGKTYRVILDFMHCEKILVVEGQKVAVGDALAIADNTGWSTGPHTHMQVRRISSWNGKHGLELAYTEADVTEANNSIDPTPYWQSVYAQDYWRMVGYYQQLLALLQQLAGLKG